MRLSDKELQEAYNEAIQLNLDQDFIEMLVEELDRRNADKNDGKRRFQKNY
ncbi:MAG: sporulation histidine kinase inhibitor Sda [Bacillaceae bacterium]|nr:sporulation histidine kinase inhibitor Sda [Bacillaceae bacterium]